MQKIILFILVLFALASCEKTKRVFTITEVGNRAVKISIDGNTWTTSKDSIKIYIDNY